MWVERAIRASLNCSSTWQSSLYPKMDIITTMHPSKMGPLNGASKNTCSNNEITVSVGKQVWQCKVVNRPLNLPQVYRAAHYQRLLMPWPVYTNDCVLQHDAKHRGSKLPICATLNAQKHTRWPVMALMTNQSHMESYWLTLTFRVTSVNSIYFFKNICAQLRTLFACVLNPFTFIDKNKRTMDSMLRGRKLVKRYESWARNN